jgi:hypothetical protein
LFTPFTPSTSWVNTNAKVLPSGQPFQPSGGAAEDAEIGQHALERRLMRFACTRRRASRTSLGMAGLIR